MTEEARELRRIIGATVRDMISAYRLQAQAGPMTEQALEGSMTCRSPSGTSTSG